MRRFGVAVGAAIVAADVVAALVMAPAAQAEVTGPQPAAVVAGWVSPLNSHLTRAPYLTDLVDKHVSVSFATDRSAKTGTVTFGRVDNTGACAPTISVPTVRSHFTVGTVAQYQWTASFSVPAYGTYCYRVLLAGTDLLGANPSPRFTTQVPAGDSSTFSFAVFGDWGLVSDSASNAAQSDLMARIAASGVRFAVTTGDNGYPSGNQVNYGDLQQGGGIFGPQRWTLASSAIPLFPSVGNHGLGGSGKVGLAVWPEQQVVANSGGRYQMDTYCCVNNSASASYASSWYAFTAGDARFYVLEAAWGDTNRGDASPYANDAAAHWDPSSAERQWLENDLKTHPTALKFAFLHYPLYADSSQESTDPYLDGPDNLEGVLAHNGVQIVFNGHAHIYQRNNPSAPGMPVTYVTGGGGGRPAPLSSCSPTDAYAVGWSITKSKGYACGAASRPSSAAHVYHFLKVTVAGTTVTVQPTDSTGYVFDAQTYHFSPATIAGQ